MGNPGVLLPGRKVRTGKGRKWRRDTKRRRVQSETDSGEETVLKEKVLSWREWEEWDETVAAESSDWGMDQDQDEIRYLKYNFKRV